MSGDGGQMVVVKASKDPSISTRMWVQLADGEVLDLHPEVATVSPWVQHEMLRTGCGISRDAPLLLPKQVGPAMLQLISEYCCFHRAPGRSDKERKQYDEKFIRLDTRRVCELTSAADALDMKPLVDLASRALARMIEGKSPEEIRETFHLPDDLTEEEKLEPLKNVTDDPRIRLLNRLYAKKRRELAEKRAKPALPAPGQDSSPMKDDRPLEDLLSFIEEPGGGKSSKGGKKKKGKAKGKRRHDDQQQQQQHLEDEASQSASHAQQRRQEQCTLDVYQQMLERLQQTGGAQQAIPSCDSLLGSFSDQDAACLHHPAAASHGHQDAPFHHSEAAAVVGSSYRPNQDWETRIAEIVAMGDGAHSPMRSAAFREPVEPATQGRSAAAASSSGGATSLCIAEPEAVGRESPDAGTCSPDLDDEEPPGDEHEEVSGGTWVGQGVGFLSMHNGGETPSLELASAGSDNYCSAADRFLSIVTAEAYANAARNEAAEREAAAQEAHDAQESSRAGPDDAAAAESAPQMSDAGQFLSMVTAEAYANAARNEDRAAAAAPDAAAQEEPSGAQKSCRVGLDDVAAAESALQKYIEAIGLGGSLRVVREEDQQAPPASDQPVRTSRAASSTLLQESAKEVLLEAVLPSGLSMRLGCRR